ncbi:MAG: DUF3325 domain-containing protein [Giesbergeria sp.]|nr:DUF3325 domain-containing protein [Giesbergeria sp.]
MPDAVMLAAALAASVLGMAWLALAMESHWEQVRGTAPLPARTVRALRWLGTVGLGASLALCLAVDHASMAALVWVMGLAASALAVAFTLTWRPRWLAALMPWVR